MAAFSDTLVQLIEALRCLPGVGPKSAQRMALHLLERNREGGRNLAGCLSHAMEVMSSCQRCRLLTESEYCALCSDVKRDPTTLCIVGSPSDVLAFEQTGGYKGLYFVLSAYLSPLDGIGPEQIGLPLLEERLKTEEINEVILAISPTVEGEATAYYISELTKHQAVKLSRIAHGVPRGSELEYIDSLTLGQALRDRALFD